MPRDPGRVDTRPPARQVSLSHFRLPFVTASCFICDTRWFPFVTLPFYPVVTLPFYTHTPILYHLSHPNFVMHHAPTPPPPNLAGRRLLRCRAAEACNGSADGFGGWLGGEAPRGTYRRPKPLLMLPQARLHAPPGLCGRRTPAGSRRGEVFTRVPLFCLCFCVSPICRASLATGHLSHSHLPHPICHTPFTTPHSPHPIRHTPFFATPPFVTPPFFPHCSRALDRRRSGSCTRVA